MFPKRSLNYFDLFDDVHTDIRPFNVHLNPKLAIIQRFSSSPTRLYNDNNRNLLEIRIGMEAMVYMCIIK